MTLVSRLVAPGWAAVRHNARPFLLIQAAVAAMVVLYYAWPPAREAGNALAEWKERGGLWFPLVSGAVAAGLLPELARRLTRAPRRRPFAWGDLLFQCAYFAWLALVIDRLYWALGELVGREPTPAVVAIKVAIDMLLFSSFLSIPMGVAAFAWKDAGFSFKRFARAMGGGEFARRWLPTLVLCWAFWTPVMAALYSLPVSLQFPIAMLAQAAWSLLLVHMASHREPV